MLPTENSARARAIAWGQAALIVAAGWFVYWPALHGDWLWDDRQDIPKNLLLRDGAGLWKIWSEPWLLWDFYPLKHTVQWLQWQLWGNHTFGYHATNVVLHLLGAFLVWRLLRQLGLRHGWLGALVFTVHPINVESVAWICELKNTLSLPPLLLAASAWVSHADHGRRRDYFAALLWFLVAMLCKTAVVMFPLTLLLYQWWKHGRLRLADGKLVAPFFAISLLLGLVTMWFQQHRAFGDAADFGGGVATRIAVAGLGTAFYLWKCVWPVGLLPVYPRWDVAPPSWWQFLPWLAFAVTGVWLWARRASWGRHALLGLGWFCLHLVPVVGFVAISFMRFTWVMDHFAYVSLPGLIGLALAGLETVQARRSPSAQLAIMAAAVALCVPLTVLAHRHAGAFRNEEALWGFAAKHYPGGWLAQHSLAIVLANSGRLPEAIERYELTLRLNPNYSEARSNYGVALRDAGRNAEAVVQLEESLRLKPNNHEAHSNLGTVLRRMGRTDEAIQHYDQALRLKPDFPDANFNLANALQSLGRHAEAVARYERVLRVEPDSADAHRNLTVSLLALGRVPEARAHYERARQLDPRVPAAQF